MTKKIQDLTGKKFNRLTVLKFSHTKGYVKYWLCRCDCGNEKVISGTHLKSGKIKSCGCFLKEKLIERNFKHGKTNTRLFRIWQHIKNRCKDKNNKYYKGRGIKICQQWLDDFKCFYDWAITNGYQDNLTIDRIDVNGNYEPSNCRWITLKEQARNKRNNVYVTYNNETHTLSEWSEITKINKFTLSTRYYRDNKRGKDLFENA